METQTPTAQESTPGPGHNQPSAFDALKDRVQQMLDLGNTWKDVEKIESEEQAKKAQDVLARVKAELKDVETARKKEKQPHIDAGKEVDTRYKGQLMTPLEKVKAMMSEKITVWLREQERKRQEEQRRRDEEALRKAEEAERAAQADAATIEDEVRADESRKEADAAMKDADKFAKSHVGVKGHYADRATSLRTYYSAEITDYDKALDHFRDHPKVRDAIQHLANQWAISPEKRKTPIPGVKLHTEQRAA